MKKKGHENLEGNFGEGGSKELSQLAKSTPSNLGQGTVSSKDGNLNEQSQKRQDSVQFRESVEKRVEEENSEVINFASSGNQFIEAQETGLEAGGMTRERIKKSAAETTGLGPQKFNNTWETHHEKVGGSLQNQGREEQEQVKETKKTGGNKSRKQTLTTMQEQAAEDRVEMEENLILLTDDGRQIKESTETTLTNAKAKSRTLKSAKNTDTVENIQQHPSKTSGSSSKKSSLSKKDNLSRLASDDTQNDTNKIRIEISDLQENSQEGFVKNSPMGQNGNSEKNPSKKKIIENNETEPQKESTNPVQQKQSGEVKERNGTKNPAKRSLPSKSLEPGKEPIQESGKSMTSNRKNNHDSNMQIPLNAFSDNQYLSEGRSTEFETGQGHSGSKSSKEATHKKLLTKTSTESSSDLNNPKSDDNLRNKQANQELTVKETGSRSKKKIGSSDANNQQGDRNGIENPKNDPECNYQIISNGDHETNSRMQDQEEFIQGSWMNRANSQEGTVANQAKSGQVTKKQNAAKLKKSSKFDEGEDPAQGESRTMESNAPGENLQEDPMKNSRARSQKSTSTKARKNLETETENRIIDDGSNQQAVSKNILSVCESKELSVKKNSDLKNSQNNDLNQALNSQMIIGTPTKNSQNINSKNQPAGASKMQQNSQNTQRPKSDSSKVEQKGNKKATTKNENLKRYLNYNFAYKNLICFDSSDKKKLLLSPKNQETINQLAPQGSVKQDGFNEDDISNYYLSG